MNKSIITKENQKKQCVIEGCDRTVHGHGLCHKHYMQKKVKGAFTDKVCSVEGCDSPFYAKGMCKRHYKQIKSYGHVFGDPNRTSRDKNVFIETDDYVKMKMFDNHSNFTAYALIDKEDSNRVSKHKWHLTQKGYVETRYKGKLLKLHQFIMDNSRGIDHINRDKLDNRKCNLRKATRLENARNAGLSRNNKTGYKGVFKRNEKYVAQISSNGQRFTLGTFGNKIDAALAYDKKAIELNGKFAYTNII